MTFVDFYKRQHKNLPIGLTRNDCQGKTYIVTGSNIGLGYQCVQHLVRFGAAKVVMGVRNLDAGDKAKSEIEAATGRQRVVDVWHIDLASYESVKKFAARAEAELDRVDALVANAAVVMAQWQEKEGCEATMAVNVISTTLLAVLMLPLMKQTATRFSVVPRITLVGSSAAFQTEKLYRMIDPENVFADLSTRDKWEPQLKSIYPFSKLVLHFASRELATYAPTAETGVVINLVSPGLCYTGLVRNVPFVLALPIHVMRLIVGRSAEMGSRTLLGGIAATENSHGKFMSECEIDEARIPAWMMEERAQKVQRQIWAELSSIIERVQPGALAAIHKP